MSPKTGLKRIADTALEWRDGVPVAPDFDDVYYSLDGGLDETNYVFIEGIGAPEVWEGKDHFTIAETGFGTGLNFLATWQKWLKTNPENRLTFISVEQFPLSRSALQKAHSAFPAVATQAKELRAAWPPASPGFHHRFFEGGKIELILIFGEAAKSYAKLKAKIDAWFLDGFAPAKNPAMWQEDLFMEMARLSKPGASFATFTAAGFVKRGLAAVGFEVKKTKGFGRKRERLIGRMCLDHIPRSHLPLPDWATPSATTTGPIAVIGAGIAGRSLAAALARRGRNVTVFSDGDACASDVPSAILAPAFQAERQPASEFIESAFCHACSYPGYTKAWQGDRGTLMAPQNDEDAERQQRIHNRLSWSPKDLQLSEDGLLYTRAGSLNTSKVLTTIWPDEQIRTEKVQSFQMIKTGWQVETFAGKSQFSCLVIATGAGTPFFIPNAPHLRMGANGGQIATIPHQTTGLPMHAYASAAYITAPENGKRTAGSTFQDALGVKPENWTANNTNLANLKSKLAEKLPFDLTLSEGIETWSGVRATSNDYLPLVGPVPDWKAASAALSPLAKNKNASLEGPMPYQGGLYLMTAFGSKGYQQAPYCAEILATIITDEALPLPYDLLEKLAPSRFLVRQIIRGKFC